MIPFNVGEDVIYIKKNPLGEDDYIEAKIQEIKQDKIRIKLHHIHLCDEPYVENIIYTTNNFLIHKFQCKITENCAILCNTIQEAIQLLWTLWHGYPVPQEQAKFTNFQSYMNYWRHILLATFNKYGTSKYLIHINMYRPTSIEHDWNSIWDLRKMYGKAEFPIFHYLNILHLDKKHLSKISWGVHCKTKENAETVINVMGTNKYKETFLDYWDRYTVNTVFIAESGNKLTAMSYYENVIDVQYPILSFEDFIHIFVTELNTNKK